MPQRLRLFLAALPDAATRRRLERLRDELARPGERRVAGGRLHLTLRFLGDTPADRLRPLIDALGRLAHPPCALRLDRIGHFRGPRILWLGPSRPPAALLELHDQVDGLADAAGIPAGAAPFRPHVTLCRDAAPGRRPARFEPIDWTVDHCTLVASHLGSQPRYEVLARQELGGTQASSH